MEFVFAIIVLVIASLLVYFLHQNNNQRMKIVERENKDLKTELSSLQQNQLAYVRKISELNAQLEMKETLLLNQKKDIVDARTQLNKDFQLLANQILEEKSHKFTSSNKENMEAILKPLSEKLNEFKVKVEETYDKESKQRFSLEEKIKELVAINNQISDDANNLTKALKGDNKIQGDWGEMILESILEKSGLKKGEHYYSQEFISNARGEKLKSAENKFMQPDVVVVYPGGRKIVLDSKVSLTAYLNYLDASDDKGRQQAEKEHILSVRRHVDELSAKAYQDHIDSLDFVMMFVPNESAYILAMQLDSNLWDYAYKKRILFINPTNLIASLKIVSDLWIREQQTKNAEEIASRGALLYDKFVGFVESLEDLGKDIDASRKTYETAISRLKDGKGNLIRQAEMLKDLGVKGQKELPN